MTVGETDYNASGRGAVKIFDENNAINFDAESRNGKVFADGANATYTLTVTATGYRNPLTIQIAPEAAEITTTVQTASTTTSTTTTASNKNNNTSNSSSASSNSAPKTGDAGVGVFAALASAAAAAAVLTRRKRSS